MIIREEGLYWVKIGSYPESYEWTTAKWHQWKNKNGVIEEGQWLGVLSWVDGYYTDSDFLEIGPRLTPPD